MPAMSAPKSDPALIRGSSLALLKGEVSSRAGAIELYVGDSEDLAQKFMVPPPNAYPFHDLPPGFPSNSYKADGWDSNNGSVGFGVIYYQPQDRQGQPMESRVALAMFRERGVDEMGIGNREGNYEDAFGQPQKSIPGPKARYWFWEDPDHQQRLMICAVENHKTRGTYDITTVVGDAVVMDALRMSEASAAEDRSWVDRPLSHGIQLHPG